MVVMCTVLQLQEQGTLLAAEDKVVTKDCAVFLTEVIQKADVALSLSDGGGSCKLLEACIRYVNHLYFVYYCVLCVAVCFVLLCSLYCCVLCITVCFVLSCALCLLVVLFD